MKIDNIRVEVNGSGVIGNWIADAAAVFAQGLDWPVAGRPSVTKGVL